MIEIKNLTKRFGKFTAIDKLNLNLNLGECIALIGPNGCGKTTLIKSILGMVLPDEGTIFFAGKSIKADNNYRSKIGYMPQIGRYPENMSIGHVIEMIQSIRSAPNKLDLDLYQQFEIGKILDKKMRTLSGGTTQKVSATLAFMFNTQVLILDEPTAGLDPVASEILKEKINDAKKKGCLVLITSHILSELEGIASQIVFMQEGKLILHKSTADLRAYTGQETIAKSIVHLLKAQKT
ncbi:MAG: ATP-binding cassette domain-containing protein [Sphingobacteriales bacterium]|jgi:Cu-processing system ATP-binding protein|nr:ATP-binding cassette domain-containing protein [Sphingobacteriales bacterium]MBP9142216.1 ATP-binding cassette domain-containing protein [Chitinophagales bacterium]MDA0199324.1 ATP-binding cassette domain-containing protein [Bacteroidota bacterium]MBK6890764.1 ATP-binding cassette domain-containing protein [Sphingobacteriales bacterium]MBK7526184.1 ATP-binding cassette domain-containing protein [Sphingobacteriales bacterium]